MPPFAFTLDNSSGIPAYRQVMDQVHGAIAAGALQAGDQLPTVRALAVELSINPNTVIRAYRELEIRGVLTTQQGIGTFIAKRKVSRDSAARQARLSRLVAELLAKAGAEGFAAEEVLSRLQEELNPGP